MRCHPANRSLFVNFHRAYSLMAVEMRTLMPCTGVLRLVEMILLSSGS
ncbi:hypothetical protein BMETH_2326_0 [methanotrophic bacterial endosymbiont of Bathymodiolus sp.]|nr:hypothetical protein BMETH_2326_0 [methanotrophic bacterial endosymbiont of Bathymodiolus sp.]